MELTQSLKLEIKVIISRHNSVLVVEYHGAMLHMYNPELYEKLNARRNSHSCVGLICTRLCQKRLSIITYKLYLPSNSNGPATFSFW